MVLTSRPMYSKYFQWHGRKFEVCLSSQQFSWLWHVLEEYYSLSCDQEKTEDHLLQFIVMDETPCREAREETVINFFGNEKVKFENGDVRTFTYEESSIYPSIQVKENRQFLLYDIKTREGLQQQLLKLIREVLVTEAESQGMVFYHASSFRMNNVGIMVTGNSSSGKSTFLSAFCKYGGADLISDEFTGLFGGSLYSDPSAISLRSVTLQKLNGESNFHEPLGKGHSELLSHKQFIDRYNCLKLESTRLDLIIIPCFRTGQGNQTSITVLSQDIGENLLMQNCVTSLKAWNHRYLLETNCSKSLLVGQCHSEAKANAEKQMFIQVDYSNQSPLNQIVEQVDREIISKSRA